MKHRNIYISLVVITFVLAFVVLHIGNVVTQLINKNEQYSKEIVKEEYIDSGAQLLKYSRENIVKELQKKEDYSVLVEYTKSLKISPIIDECAVVQISPKTEVLWTTNGFAINNATLDDIRKNIDCSDVYNNIYKITSDNKVIVWAGIPHGTIDYQNIKWVIIAEIDTSNVVEKINDYDYKLLTKLINTIALLSSISTIILSLSIAFMQREFYKWLE